MLNKIVSFSLALLVSFSLLAIERDYHGIQVDDPYAWLEEIEAPDTKKWIAQQTEKANLYFNDSEEREVLKEKVRQYFPTESFGVPIKKAGKIFYMMQREGEEKRVLCMESPTGERSILVNPNTLVERTAILSGFEVSPNGKILAYGLSEAGGDLQTWFFLNLETGETFSSHISGLKFSNPQWSSDNKSLYYIHFSKENKSQAIYRHVIDLPQHRDQKIYGTGEDAEFLLGRLFLVQGEKYLLVSERPSKSKENGITLINLDDGCTMNLFPPGEAEVSFIGEKNNRLLFTTDNHASNFKIISLDLSNVSDCQAVVKECSMVLIEACCTKDYIVCSYLENCCAKLAVFDYAGRFIKEISLSGKGTVSVPWNGVKLSGGHEDNKLFFSYTDFLSPSTIYSYDGSTDKTIPFLRSSTQSENSYVVEQKFFMSKDGTQISLFIMHKQGISLDGSHPTLMYGYGGFGLSITPSYSPLVMSWLDSGGIYVSVNLRGGGEYGKNWYETGKLHQKQNVFDDFISAGEWLIQQGYTTPQRLAITGRSNGGLLVGACLVQRPDLFAAAIPQVGVFDMLRFHKFTVGWLWKCDFGDPDDPEDFAYLYAYSPYHNLKQGVNYPSTLVTTADHDDRVVPIHSYKFAARLQEVQSGSAPTLLRIYANTGHGQGSSIAQAIEEYTDILLFLKQELSQ